MKKLLIQFAAYWFVARMLLQRIIMIRFIYFFVLNLFTVVTMAQSSSSPFSKAIIQNGFVFISGQVGIDPSTNHFQNQSFEAEMHQVMCNIVIYCRSRN